MVERQLVEGFADLLYSGTCSVDVAFPGGSQGRRYLSLPWLTCSEGAAEGLRRLLAVTLGKK